MMKKQQVIWIAIVLLQQSHHHSDVKLIFKEILLLFFFCIQLYFFIYFLLKYLLIYYKTFKYFNRAEDVTISSSIVRQGIWEETTCYLLIFILKSDSLCTHFIPRHLTLLIRAKKSRIKYCQCIISINTRVLFLFILFLALLNYS